MDNGNKMFFGENGMKAQKADYAVQLARARIEQIKKKFSDICLYNHKTIYYSDFRSVEKISVVEGITTSQCKAIVSDIRNTQKLNELIIWLEGSAKVRQSMKNEVKNMPEKDVCTILGIDYPEKPELLELMSDDDQIATLSIKERNQLYSLKAEASTIGKAVHDNGFLTNARDAFHEKMAEGCTVRESGVHVCFNTYTAEDGTEEAIEEIFFSLQNRYREVQARLNSMLHNITEVVREENIRRNEENLRLQSAYEAAIASVRDQVKNWRTEQCLMIDDLRVILPENLQPTYDKLVSRNQLPSVKGSWSDVTSALSEKSLD